MSDYHEPDISDKIRQGACRYCGQIQNVQIIGEITRKEADDYASLHCFCDESTRLRERLKYEEERRQEREKTLRRVNEVIEGLCGEGSKKYNLTPIPDAILKMLATLAEMIFDEDLDKVAFDVTQNIKVKISKTAKGKIQIYRSDAAAFKHEV